MKKIDRATVTRILDTADIVEVVSDFVTLKRRGANYIGLCPFHSERTPSFSVSKSKGICKCFSCGKGGSPVNFLMELEQMSYQEALRWLAKKYNIEINEREETEQERQAASLREALFAVNQYAMEYFENILNTTEDGRDIGMAYFLERGLNPETIKRFHLGYAQERGDSFLKAAVKAGFDEENLLKTGLCARSDRGPYDRFRGRVIYPVHSISGKIVAFGGRTLKTDKSVAKYVNSPESEIYSKSRELYGLYQARREIVRLDRCILVEGYMDVISMSQSGVENVVASSGTSLTEQQVNLIHRFTDNVTVIYDADAAGIKASLRGVDMLLKEGMNVKVVLFPEGEDPDSYARSHTREELADYLAKNATDFIKFKTTVLLTDVADDPIGRSHAISDILKSISVIPDQITRQVYIEESARSFDMDSKVLAREVAKFIAKQREDDFNRRKTPATPATEQSTGTETATATPAEGAAEANQTPAIALPNASSSALMPYEKAIIRYIVRYGMINLCEAIDDDGNPHPMTVLEYINYEFEADQITFTDPVIARLHARILDIASNWHVIADSLGPRAEEIRQQMTAEGQARIRDEAKSIADIQKAEENLQMLIQQSIDNLETDERRQFFVRQLLSDADDDVRRLATELADDRYQLSKVHSKFAHIQTEEERLPDLVPRAVFELKDAILGIEIENIKAQIRQRPSEQVLLELMTRLMDKTRIKAEFAQYLGERIVLPQSRK